MGALIISPTRELAVQIFDVLRKIGRNHAFSAGLVIGGKSLREEAERLGRMNILVCTPGRMLQHLDQTARFDVDNLQVLVLDEADRIMDMGFASAVDALIEHLPKSRQTMLFSATQSKKLSDLTRLSLRDPEYISVHSSADAATPSTLQQHYILTPLPEKLETLYGFIKTNLKSKTVVFLSSGKQVRFVYESFRQLQPGIPLLHLHGRQKQQARLEITRRFAASKYSCLFATDVVARGVDFPAVDWVIQVDCPEDADTYIHRVGRTARYESNGRAVLFLDPSEEDGMLKRLQEKKVPVQKVHVRDNKRKSITDQLQSMCFRQPDLKYLAQKSFISYARSVYLQKDKETFKFSELDLDGFASKLGLPGTPQIKFQKGQDIKRIKNASRAALSSGSEGESETEDVDGEAGDDDNKKNKKKDKKSDKEEVRTKYQKMAERTNQDVFSEHYRKLVGDEDSDDDQDFLSVKRVMNDEALDKASKNDPSGGFKTKVLDMGGDQQFVIDSNRREKLLKSKKKLLKFKGKGSKLVFDDEGNAHAMYEFGDDEEFRRPDAAEQFRRDFVDAETSRAREADVEDKELAKKRRKEKREKRKARERGEEEEARREERTVTIGPAPGEEEEDPLALLRSLPLEEDGRGKGASDDERHQDEEARPRKKVKKWFQDDSDEEGPEKKGGRKVIEMDRDPDTLEDLEALASGLLD